MTTRVVSLCHGWACPKMTRCAKSDYNAPAAPLQTWTRHYQAVIPGDNCPDFEPIRPPIGYGPEDPRI